MIDPNRWQQLHFLGNRLDQFGTPINESTQKNLTPFWGDVKPFALTPAQRSANGVYLDQGPPAQLGGPTDAEFKQINALTMIRLSAQLDPNDGVMINISPATRGNTPDAPFTESYDQVGYSVNPYTGQPYAPQLVKQADFGRVMAEFWADGPHSDAPPGHWNEIGNYVADRMDELGIPKRIGGTGPVVDNLEYDVKRYFAENGALHDAAISAWNHKGVYDSARPISFIRYMGQLGQSTDPNLTVDLGGGNIVNTYNPEGLPLEPGLVEVITPETTAPGQRHEQLAGHEGEIAIKSWQGAINGLAPFDDPADISGVDWILAKNWMPYQLISFVTPPFPGYVSGHSTYSRSAAEVLTLLTGSPYFPGGLGEYVIDQGSGLNFEYGPTTELALQWATYFDASDQAALSRVFGGIHPPTDDFAGRRIGHIIGPEAWALAMQYFSGHLVPEPSSCLLLIFRRRDVPWFGRAAPKRLIGLWPRTTQIVARVAWTYPTSRLSSFVQSRPPGLRRWRSRCPDCASAVVYTNVTASAGINYKQNHNLAPGGAFQSGGAAAADYDNDGWVDLYVTRLDGADILYHNLGNGTFQNVAAASGFTANLPTNGAAWGDVDNDGDKDLFVTSCGDFGVTGATRFYLYINDGNGHFTEEAVQRAADVGGIPRFGMSATFGDYDGDGYLDIHTNDWATDAALSTSRLLHNLGAANPGHFEDVTAAAGLDVYRPSHFYGGADRFERLPLLIDLYRPRPGWSPRFGHYRRFQN